jgi:hypothetical protein
MANKYISQCCGVQAKKPPCVRPKSTKVFEYRVEQDEPASLNKWKCTSCGKSCKVRVVYDKAVASNNTNS